MANFVLVHGGGHGGWCFRKLARLLREAGHEVYTPTLTGLGERIHLLSPETDLSTHITDIVNILIYEDLEDVMLVGHSYGGMVITGVADRAGERIRELVFLDAAHPSDGESLVDVAPGSMAFARSSSRTIDGVELVMWPDETMVAAMGVTSPDDLALLRGKMNPHPWKAFAEKLHFRNGDAALAIPRTNITATSSKRQRAEEAQTRAPSAVALETIGRYFEIDTGHDLMLTEPRRVADILLEVAAG